MLEGLAGRWLYGGENPHPGGAVTPEQHLRAAGSSLLVKGAVGQTRRGDTSVARKNKNRETNEERLDVPTDEASSAEDGADP